MSNIKRDHAREELVQACQSLLDTKTGSDFTIICRGQKFEVHSVIIGSRSDFFRAACRLGFKEAETRTVELKEDDPFMVSRMIKYLYTLDYDEPKDPSVLFASEPSNHSNSAFYLHVHMYVMGDKFGIWGLKKIAEAKFEEVLTQKLDVLDFLPAVAKIYESTPENDRGLRDAVVRLAGLDLRALTKSTLLKDVIVEVPEFACDVIKWASKNATKPTTRFLDNCRGCHKRTYGKIEKLRCTECNYLKNAPV